MANRAGGEEPSYKERKYLNRLPKLFDEILLLCNGKSYEEIVSALEEVGKVIKSKSILTYSVNDYTPPRLQEQHS